MENANRFHRGKVSRQTSPRSTLTMKTMSSTLPPRSRLFSNTAKTLPHRETLSSLESGPFFRPLHKHTHTRTVAL